MQHPAALAFALVLIMVPLVLLLAAAALRYWERRARERRIDANLIYEASKVVECGFRGDMSPNARCIKLKGHVENGDPRHMFYSDDELI